MSTSGASSRGSPAALRTVPGPCSRVVWNVATMEVMPPEHVVVGQTHDAIAVEIYPVAARVLGNRVTQVVRKRIEVAAVHRLTHTLHREQSTLLIQVLDLKDVGTGW